MTNTANIKVDGHELKVIVTNDGRTREKIVSLVQDLLKKKRSLATFSLAGLDKLLRCEAPKKDCEEVLEALAEVLNVSLSSFAEFEAKAS